MLILSLKVEETIVIGMEGEITIKLLAARHRRAQLGVEAPRAIPIWRKTVLDRIKNEGRDGHDDRLRGVERRFPGDACGDRKNGRSAD